MESQTSRVGTQDIDTKILISLNMTGLILGSDWMEKNKCVFDCKRKQVCVNNEWIALKKEPVDRRIGGIYVTPTMQLSAFSVDKVAKTNIQFSAHNADRVNKNTQTNISPSQEDAAKRPRRMTDTFTDIAPPLVDVPNAREHSQNERPGRNMNILEWNKGDGRRRGIMKRRRTNNVQTESRTAPAIHSLPSLNHTTRRTNLRPRMTITNSWRVSPVSPSTIELKGRGPELGIDEFVRLNF